MSAVMIEKELNSSRGELPLTAGEDEDGGNRHRSGSKSRSNCTEHVYANVYQNLGHKLYCSGPVVGQDKAPIAVPERRSWTGTWPWIGSCVIQMYLYFIDL